MCASAPGGVGIVFVRDATDCLYVNCLVRDGPAHRSGVIQHGMIQSGHDSLRLHSIHLLMFPGYLEKRHRRESALCPDLHALPLPSPGDILRFVDGVDVSEMLSGAFVGFPVMISTMPINGLQRKAYLFASRWPDHQHAAEAWLCSTYLICLSLLSASFGRARQQGRSSLRETRPP